jgi:hypothetical protein
MISRSAEYVAVFGACRAPHDETIIHCDAMRAVCDEIIVSSE